MRAAGGPRRPAAARRRRPRWPDRPTRPGSGPTTAGPGPRSRAARSTCPNPTARPGRRGRPDRPEGTAPPEPGPWRSAELDAHRLELDRRADPLGEASPWRPARRARSARCRRRPPCARRPTCPRPRRGTRPRPAAAGGRPPGRRAAPPARQYKEVWPSSRRSPRTIATRPGPEAGQELEGERGQEGHPERAQRRPAEPLAGLDHLSASVVDPSERPQRREPLDQFEQVGRQRRQAAATAGWWRRWPGARRRPSPGAPAATRPDRMSSDIQSV